MASTGNSAAPLTYQRPQDHRAELAAARRSDEPGWSLACTWAVGIGFGGAIALGILLFIQDVLSQ
jgi:hypothetical protein